MNCNNSTTMKLKTPHSHWMPPHLMVICITDLPAMRTIPFFCTVMDSPARKAYWPTTIVRFDVCPGNIRRAHVGTGQISRQTTGQTG